MEDEEKIKTQLKITDGSCFKLDLLRRCDRGILLSLLDAFAR